MIRSRAVALSCLLAVAPGLALAQSPDAAAERARLANERIQAEAERQAREAAAASSSQAAVPVAAPGSTQAGPRPSLPEGSAAQARPTPVDADRTDRGLRQLRELGKLKDAGYLTDPEFARIKQQILDSHF
jgi:hypothetical protein